MHEGFLPEHVHNHNGPFGMKPTAAWTKAVIKNDTAAMSRMRLEAIDWLRNN